MLLADVVLVSKDFGLLRLPSTFLIDTTRKIVMIYYGTARGFIMELQAKLTDVILHPPLPEEFKPR